MKSWQKQSETNPSRFFLKIKVKKDFSGFAAYQDSVFSQQFLLKFNFLNFPFLIGWAARKAGGWNEESPDT
jgi:hypothetical protein